MRLRNERDHARAENTTLKTQLAELKEKLTREGPGAVATATGAGARAHIPFLDV